MLALDELDIAPELGAIKGTSISFVALIGRSSLTYWRRIRFLVILKP